MQAGQRKRVEYKKTRGHDFSRDFHLFKAIYSAVYPINKRGNFHVLLLFMYQMLNFGRVWVKIFSDERIFFLCTTLKNTLYAN